MNREFEPSVTQVCSETWSKIPLVVGVNVVERVLKEEPVVERAMRIVMLGQGRWSKLSG